MTTPTQFDLVCSVVVYQQSAEVLRPCFESFFASKNLKTKLVVVDNSPQDTLRSFCADFDIDYLYMGENLGFGRAHNQAISKYRGQGKYHLVLNPDVSFDENLLKNLFDFMQENHDIGLTIPLVTNEDGSLQKVNRRLPDPFVMILRRFLPSPLKNLFRKRESDFLMEEAKTSQPYHCPSISGCFMFLRGTVLAEVGGFDDRYFMYVEDVDLSRRIFQQSTNVVFTEGKIIHGWDQGDKRSTRLLWFHIRSAIQYFLKWGWFFDRERSTLNQRAGNPYKTQQS